MKKDYRIYSGHICIQFTDNRTPKGDILCADWQTTYEA